MLTNTNTHYRNTLLHVAQQHNVKALLLILQCNETVITYQSGEQELDQTLRTFPANIHKHSYAEEQRRRRQRVKINTQQHLIITAKPDLLLHCCFFQ